MTNSDELVSVVVPAYNAAATIDETLASVRAQTWRALEIIVVDDGSKDRTAEIAAMHARDDPRIRVLCRPNGGVAAARNHGIADARADYVAPVDADDLWAPDKIELQMAEMLRAGERMGLVYTWFVHIDAESRRSPYVVAPVEEGYVFREMCRSNFIGNGSSALMRRKAILEAGGYDSSLRARNAEGCEDIMLYLSIAEHYDVGLVRKPVTGYRITANNMSSNILAMYRSASIVLEHFRNKRPDLIDELNIHHDDCVMWLTSKALLAGNLPAAFKLARIFVDRQGPSGLRQLQKIFPLVVNAMLPKPVRALRRKAVNRFRAPRPHFLVGGDGQPA